jgi:hypothetical protein
MERRRGHRVSLFATLAAGAIALQPLCSEAQVASAPGPWRSQASLYVYLPTVEGTSRFPPNSDGSGPSLEVDVGNLADKIQGFFMASFEADNGVWGVFTDFMYLHAGNDRQNSRDFTIGGVLDASTSADLGWDLRGSIWTLAGKYRVLSQPATQMDLLAGARMANIEQELRFDISGSLGALPPASRAGRAEYTQTLWDAVIGVKGRHAFGEGRRWSVPFYLDVGAGESKLTWQAAAGLGYAFSWGNVSLLWRHLAYEMKAGQPTRDLSFSGPMIGAGFNF